MNEVRKLLNGKPAVRYVVYTLYSLKANRTYTGCTPLGTVARRIRQHRGVIKGGAKSTSGYDDWEVRWVLTCDGMNRNTALSMEWRIKHHVMDKRSVDKVMRYCKAFDSSKPWMLSGMM